MLLIFLVFYVVFPINNWSMSLQPKQIIKKQSIFRELYIDITNQFTIYKTQPIKSVSMKNDILYLQPYIYINNITRAIELQIAISYFPSIIENNSIKNNFDLQLFKISSTTDSLTFPIIVNHSPIIVQQTNIQNIPITGYIFLFENDVDNIYQLIIHSSQKCLLGLQESKYYYSIVGIPQYTGSFTSFLKEDYTKLNTINGHSEQIVYHSKLSKIQFSLESKKQGDTNNNNFYISENDTELFNYILSFYRASI